MTRNTCATDTFAQATILSPCFSAQQCDLAADTKWVQIDISNQYLWSTIRNLLRNLAVWCMYVSAFNIPQISPRSQYLVGKNGEVVLNLVTAIFLVVVHSLRENKVKPTSPVMCAVHFHFKNILPTCPCLANSALILLTHIKIHRKLSLIAFSYYSVSKFIRERVCLLIMQSFLNVFYFLRACQINLLTVS